MAITQSKPGIFLSQPVLQSIPMNPTPCKTHWNSAGRFYVCGTGRQPILRNKMENDNYYLLTLAAIAKEIKQRGGKTECSVRIAAGLPLAGFGREKKPFREYLLRSSQLADGLRPVCFKFEGIAYKITIEDVKLFPQGIPPLLCIQNSSRMSLLFFLWTSAAGLLI